MQNYVGSGRLGMEVRSLRNIVAGEELTLSYVFLVQKTTAQRRAHLERFYFFTCHCDRCDSVSGSRHKAWREETLMEEIKMNKHKIFNLLRSAEQNADYGSDDYGEAQTMLIETVPLMQKLTSIPFYPCLTQHLLQLARTIFNTVSYNKYKRLITREEERRWLGKKLETFPVTYRNLPKLTLHNSRLDRTAPPRHARHGACGLQALQGRSRPLLRKA